MNTTMQKPHQRLLAIALSFVMLLGVLPMTAFAESDIPDMGVSGEIIAFESLTEETANQTIPLGTSLDKLNLPETLTATLRVAAPTDATISSGKVSETTESTIPVSMTWVSEPEYDGDTEGTYIFTAQMSGYTLSAEPPFITVTVGKAAQKITLLIDVPLAAGDVNRTHYAYDATAKKLTIKTNEGPASYKYYKDIPIADVTTVEILDGVTYIDASAFENFSALTSVRIAESVTKINAGAFVKCSALTSILLPLKLTSIGDSAFADCALLAGITIPNLVTSIGASAFFECSSLSSILIPPSVTSIGARAFEGCTSLKAIGIPNLVSRIEAWTFENCTSLASITIPDSVTFVGHQAFWKCTSLTSVTLPKTVTSISEGAFQGCLSLTIRLTSDTAPSFGIEWANSVPAVYYPGKWGAPNTITNLNYSNNAKGIIDHAKIQGIYQPFGNIAPYSTVTETAQYTGTVTWSPNDNPFKGKTVYTATITLNPKDGFTLLYVPANFFTLPFGPPNVSSVSNAANSGVITAVFPETSEFLAITIKDIPGVAVPVAGAIPVDKITETEQYTGTVTWFPADSIFKPNTVYTATITLTPKDNFVFLSVGENFFTVAGANTSNAAWSSKVTAVFPAAPTYTATVNPTNKTFTSATAGYGAQAAEQFTITNTGTGQITGLSAVLGGSDFEISTALSGTSVNAGETATISVRPKTGLAVGIHTDTLTITGSNGISLTANLSFEVTTAPTYTATVSPTSKTFPAATSGYSAQIEQQFTITNTGTGQITGLSAIFGGSSFEISTVLLETSINAGETATISVRPKTGLAVGTHTDMLTITGNNGVSLMANLSFEVMTAPTYTVTNAATDVTSSGARVSGNVTSDGGAAVTERGFVYGRTANPAIGGAGVTQAVSGNGTGTFTANISGLTANTTYHVRAYATNSEGTGYGADVTFTTLTDDDDEPSYIPRTLTDSATGITVSGNSIHRYAQLTVKPLSLHDDPACDAIRAAQTNGQLILGFDISLSRGFLGPLTISIPVGSQYNGQTVTILRCVNGRLETINATVVDGAATFTVTALSPFVVTTGLLVPDSVVTDPPKTGEAATPWGFVLIVLAVVCAGYMVMKRRKA